MNWTVDALAKLSFFGNYLKEAARVRQMNVTQGRVTLDIMEQDM